MQRAYDTIMPLNQQLAVLQCTAGYPAAFEELDLRVIGTFRDRFPGAVIGFSSHDNGIAMPVAAYMLGARIVEKHFTLNRTSKGTDHAFSLEPVGLRKMVRDLERTHKALGNGVKKIYESEKAPIVKMVYQGLATPATGPWKVLARTNPVRRSGWSRATSWATAPPIEWPTRAKRSQPRSSARARTSAARISKL